MFCCALPVFSISVLSASIAISPSHHPSNTQEQGSLLFLFLLFSFFFLRVFFSPSSPPLELHLILLRVPGKKRGRKEGKSEKKQMRRTQPNITLQWSCQSKINSINGPFSFHSATIRNTHRMLRCGSFVVLNEL